MMQIYCPKCETGYEIDESLISQKGKKLRCGVCGLVFKASRDDLIPSQINTAAFEEVESKEPAVSAEAEEKAAEPEVRSITTEPEGESEEKSAENIVEEISAETEKQPEEEPTAVSEETSELTEDELAAAQSESEENAADVNLAPTEENVEMDDIFKRLSQQTEDLFKAENELPPHKKALLKCRKIIGMQPRTLRYYAAGIVLVLLVLFAYGNRYGIVRAMPFMNGVYRVFGIKATIPGEGLQFQNISWETFDDDYVRTLEVKGFITNPTNKDIAIPLIHVEMLDKDAVQLQSLNQKSTVQVLKAGTRAALSIIVKKPSPLTKYVYLTFIDAE